MVKSKMTAERLALLSYLASVIGIIPSPFYSWNTFSRWATDAVFKFKHHHHQDDGLFRSRRSNLECWIDLPSLESNLNVDVQRQMPPTVLVCHSAGHFTHSSNRCRTSRSTTYHRVVIRNVKLNSFLFLSTGDIFNKVRHCTSTVRVKGVVYDHVFLIVLEFFLWVLSRVVIVIICIQQLFIIVTKYRISTFEHTHPKWTQKRNSPTCI